jgi:hypothetical protein
MTRENGVTYSMAVPILRPDPAEEAAEGEEDAGVPGTSAITLTQTPQHNTVRNRNTLQYRRMLDADSFWCQRLLTESCVSQVWPTAMLLYNTSTHTLMLLPAGCTLRSNPVEASWDEFEEFEDLSESDYTSVDELDMPAAARVPSPAAAMAAQAYEAVVTSSSPTATRRPQEDHRVEGEDNSPSAALGRSDSPAHVRDPEAVMDAQQQLGDASVAAVISVRPRGWGAAAAAAGIDSVEGAATAGGSSSRGASRAASRRGQRGSRGSSPALEIPLEGTAVMTPDMLKVGVVLGGSAGDAESGRP